MNPKKLMKDLQAAQDRLTKELQEARVTASAGGDMVTATVNGGKELVALKIDPEVVNKEDVEMLQDLIVAAIKEAQRRADEAVQQKIGAMSAGLGIPGM